MNNNCRYIKQGNLQTTIFSPEKYFVCPSKDECPHNQKLGLISEKAHICNADPFLRAAIKYSHKTIKDEHDIETFYETEIEFLPESDILKMQKETQDFHYCDIKWGIFKDYK